MLIRGDKLTAEQTKQVLNAFIYRWTTGNTQRTRVYKACPNCDIKTPYVNTASAAGHNHPTMPLQTDEQWLKDHAFHFTKDGKRLMANRHHAEPAFLAEREESKPITCPQCNLARINGVICHETGCPNSGARYDSESGEWIKQRECFECGCTVDADDPCCNAPYEFDDDEFYDNEDSDEDEEK